MGGRIEAAVERALSLGVIFLKKLVDGIDKRFCGRLEYFRCCSRVED